MIILGIDPGLAATGWGVISKNKDVKLINYGCISTDKKTEYNQRLLEIYQKFKTIAKKYQPAVVCIEKIFFNTNAKTALLVGEARGVAKTCAFLNRVELVEFTPLQIKMGITGYGRADKKQIQSMIKTLLKLEEIPQPDDAADAVAVALTYCFFNQNLREK